MILAHPQLDTVLDFEGLYVNSLVVEHPGFYRSLMQDLYGQLEGIPGKLVLSERGDILPMGKWVELVDNCIHFELDRKPLLNKVCSAMERTAMSDEIFWRRRSYWGGWSCMWIGYPSSFRGISSAKNARWRDF